VDLLGKLKARVAEKLLINTQRVQNVSHAAPGTAAATPDVLQRRLVGERHKHDDHVVDGQPAE
jgi:hypothetical protein